MSRFKLLRFYVFVEARRFDILKHVFKENHLKTKQHFLR